MGRSQNSQWEVGNSLLGNSQESVCLWGVVEIGNGYSQIVDWPIGNGKKKA